MKSPSARLKITSSLESQLAPMLRLYHQGQFLETFRLQNGTNLVGRDPSNQVILDSSFVSRHHFSIERTKDSADLLLRDLKSRNGTFVNREKVGQSKLENGDRISCGPYELAVFIPIPLLSSAATEMEIKDPDSISNSPLSKDTVDLPIESEPADSLEKWDEEALVNDTIHEKTERKDALVEPKAPSATPQTFKDEVRPVKPSFDEAVNTHIPAPLGLESADTIPPTQEADAMVLPDRVVLKRKGPSKLGKVLSFLAMVLVSASLAYGMFVWRHKRNIIVETADNDPIGAQETLDNTGESSKVTPQKPKAQDPRPEKSTKKTRSSSKPKPKKRGATVGDLGIDRTLLGVLEDSANLKAADGLALAKRRKLRKGKDSFKNFGASHLTVYVEPPPKGAFKSEKKKTAEVTRQDYHKEIKANLGFVEECFVSHARSAEKKGSIVLRLTMGQKGRVSKSVVNSSIFKTRKLDSCIKSGISQIETSDPPWKDYTARFRFRLGGVNSHQFK